jgi:hypothetical protein
MWFETADDTVGDVKRVAAIGSAAVFPEQRLSLLRVLGVDSGEIVLNYEKGVYPIRDDPAGSQ